MSVGHYLSLQPSVIFVQQMTSPKTVQSGGPLISLETISDPKTLCLVWMSISSNEVPITGYLVYLNDQQCGPKVGKPFVITNLFASSQNSL